MSRDQTWYRWWLSKKLHLSLAWACRFTAGPDRAPHSEYLAINWRKGAGWSTPGWTLLLRVRRYRRPLSGFAAPLWVFARTWRDVERALYPGRFTDAG
jgi:hypothetical protein